MFLHCEEGAEECAALNEQANNYDVRAKFAIHQKQLKSWQRKEGGKGYHIFASHAHAGKSDGM